MDQWWHRNVQMWSSLHEGSGWHWINCNLIPIKWENVQQMGKDCEEMVSASFRASVWKNRWRSQEISVEYQVLWQDAIQAHPSCRIHTVMLWHTALLLRCDIQFVLEYKVYFQHYVFKMPVLGMSVNMFLTVMEAISKNWLNFWLQEYILPS